MMKTSEMLLGALVADAACLGTHWIYQPERIAEIAARQDGQAAFTPVDPANYEGVKGFFAHGARRNGMLTQVGEVLRLAIQSINANAGAFDADAYQAAFAAHFGAGGSYQGYIDGPTKAALTNIAAQVSPTGSDDDQTPALARLPAIVAAYHGTDALGAMITASMQVTNVHDVAGAYNAAFADVLVRVMDGASLADALDAGAQGADDAIKADLMAALSSDEQSSTVFAGLTGMMGRACNLPSAGPVMFHILRDSGSYAEAIERNILAGGDSAGRSIMIGAIMACVHGVGTPKGIPLDWVLHLDGAAQIWSECQMLGADTQPCRG